MERTLIDNVLFRITAVFIGCTILLTASFVGFLTVVSGDITGYESRIAWYVMSVAVMFVGTIVLLELNGADGKTILVSAIVTAVLGFILLFFSFEGLLYAISNPDEVFVSQLIIYFFAAALMATGIGFWGLRHWREFTDKPPGSI